MAFSLSIYLSAVLFLPFLPSFLSSFLLAYFSPLDFCFYCPFRYFCFHSFFICFCFLFFLTYILQCNLYSMLSSHSPVSLFHCGPKQSRRKYRVSCSSVHSFIRTAHSFACSPLLALLERSTALIHLLARSLTHTQVCGKEDAGTLGCSEPSNFFLYVHFPALSVLICFSFFLFSAIFCSFPLYMPFFFPVFPPFELESLASRFLRVSLWHLSGLWPLFKGH